ncbi:hypothetical protein FRC01_006861, partial [Tulasnella sp. 417]
MAPPPQQQRTMKQRRVSLPASASMQSISARLDPRLNGGAATTSSSHNGTLHASEKNHNHQIMGPPSSTITNQPRGSGNWGARSSRDDSSLPSSTSSLATAPGSPPSPSLDDDDYDDMSNGHHHARRASASYGPAAPHLALSTAGDHASAASTGSRRRRAATVSTNKPGAKANASNGDFIVPPNPSSSSAIPSASSSNGNSHSTSSASSSLSPPPPEPSPPQGEPSSSNAGGPPTKVRKPRKRWTMEETQALVDGCNKWGVGNWKAILNDSQFQFQGRSPVDLKDRFRTYFPDAYRFHYPNAKTHLSSRVRSFLPDGTSIFEKTRSKKRRPFSAEEDEALRLGYEKHGTTWATIVKDPIFQSQERRSTDLRDRFRNAFPELYKAAGYKPRPRASTSAASRAAAGSSTAVTSGAVTPSSTAKASTSTASEPSKKGRGRGRAASASTSQSSSVAHSASSSRRKRGSTSAAGERPIGPGEPTAIDFYRPRSSHQHSSISSSSTPKVAPENIPIMDSEDEESSEYEYEEEEQYFPLTSIDASQLTSGITSPAKTESHFGHANHHANGLGDSASDLHLKSEEDMDVDGDVMFHDEELDGTALSPGGPTSPSSPSDAIHSAAGTSPVVSQTIHELLDNAHAMRGLPSVSALDQSFRDGHPFRTGGGASTDPFRNPRPPIQPHHSTASTTSLNTSAASEDWQSMSSSHNGGFGAGANANGGGLPNSAAWMSNPASPTPSDFFIPQPPAFPSTQMGRIGKSAWGPLDWLSNNPRLDQGGSGALTSWPTPLSEQYAAFDRYDLYSTVEAAHDFASEAD